MQRCNRRKKWKNGICSWRIICTPPHGVAMQYVGVGWVSCSNHQLARKAVAHTKHDSSCSHTLHTHLLLYATRVAP
jgi:hypothetical protein